MYFPRNCSCNNPMYNSTELCIVFSSIKKFLHEMGFIIPYSGFILSICFLFHFHGLITSRFFSTLYTLVSVHSLTFCFPWLLLLSYLSKYYLIFQDYPSSKNVYSYEILPDTLSPSSEFPGPLLTYTLDFPL